MKRRAFLKGVSVAAVSGGMVAEPSLSVSGPALVSIRDEHSTSEITNDSVNERSLFYKPIGGRVGDVIPFFDDGQFRIFHLHKADGVRSDTTWHQVSTQDFVHFKEWGEMLPRGTSDDQDLSVATGSIIKSGGLYHAFYTGYNSARKPAKPEQGVLHAVSEDLLKWRKIPAHTFYAPEGTYERDDWRDPFVFWNQDAGEYWMLVAARLKNGPKRRRGCTALCVSKDLAKWEIRQPFWAPGLYYTHECPDLFRMGDWWYLVFSEFSESSQTRYRMSRSLSGPWIAPAIDTFDTRALYAAKTTSDGHGRFLFGWNPLRTGATDDGPWEWGGNLVVHKLVQQTDGTLSVEMPETIKRAFSTTLPLQLRPAIGRSEIAHDHTTINAGDSFGSAIVAPMQGRCLIRAGVEFAKETQSFGLMLKLSDDLDTCYYVRAEPNRQRIVFDRWPRPGDLPFAPGMERALSLTPGKPLTIEAIVDETIAVIYVDGIVALSTRIYSSVNGSCAVFVEGGSATFRNFGIHSMNQEAPRTT